MLSHCVLNHWSTPISGASSVTIESVEADGHLSITLKATVCDVGLLMCFSFVNYQWYQIKKFQTSYDLRFGRTQLHDCSIASEWDSASLFNLKAFQTALISSRDCLLSSLPFESSHFVIIEDDSEVEVISSAPPAISVIGREPLRSSSIFTGVNELSP